MKNKSYYIMGLPEACKTTYLAALWYCLNNSKSSSLKLKQIIGDQRYLSEISLKWADVEEVSRTKPDFEQKKITLLLENSAKNLIEVSFPDLSGESFQAQYEKRETTQQIANYVGQCDGMLLFINPERITEATFISEIPNECRSNDATNEENSSFTQRNPLEDPTQVQLVELLQFINYIRANQRIKLAVIISAWDRVEISLSHLKNKPKDFVMKRLPMLWQYLESNSNYFRTMYYGISAQGGQLSESDSLLSKEDPFDRIIVVDEQGNRSHDITLPLNLMVSE